VTVQDTEEGVPKRRGVFPSFLESTEPADCGREWENRNETFFELLSLRAMK
jgi:hypothetical protein